MLVMSAVNRMDATAVDVFAELNEDLESRGIRLHLAEVKGPVQDRRRAARSGRRFRAGSSSPPMRAFEALR